jgi:large subunit ribosomal protein L33
MAKANKETTFLVSSAGTGFFYSNRKNKKKFKGEKKLALKKYDPIARKHVQFGEKKLSALKKKFKYEAFAGDGQKEVATEKNSVKE